MIQYLHLFVLHFSAWLSVLILLEVHQNGLPNIKEIPAVMASSGVLGLIGSIISAHGHSHYENYIKGLIG